MKTTKIQVIAGIGGICVVGAAFAQTALYQEITSSHLPAMLAGPCMDAAAGDVDGDGDPDLVLAMEFQPNILLLNDGAGKFTDNSDQLPRTVHDSEDVAFADFDNDGDPDLVFVSEDDRTDELYLNDGAGNFTDASTRLQTDDVSNALVVMDLNADNIPDLLTGNIGLDRALISDGRGGFRDETTERWPQDGTSRTQDLEVADIDGDGDLDMLVGNEGQNQLFLNEGGRFVDVTPTNLPARNDETREIRAIDVDGDNDLDLLVANVRFGMQESAQDYLLLNDGKGVFTTAEAARFPEDARSNFTVQAIDIDRDGDMDVLAPSTVFPRNEAEFLVTFKTESGETQIAGAPELDLNDIDGDGDVDAIVSDGNRSHTFINDGDGLVASPAQPAWPNTRSFNAIDINDDGVPELSVATIAAGQLQSSANNAPIPAPQSQARSNQVQVVDLGQDGDIDIVVSLGMTMDTAGTYLVLLNDGSGNFAAAAEGTVLPSGADGNGFDIEVADFDGDGITDLFFCNRASITESAVVSGGLQHLLRGVDIGN